MAMLVARATPPASIPNPATKARSSTMLEMQDTTRNHSDAGQAGDPPGDCRSCHEDGALGVDKGLHGHVPEGVQRVVEADGQADERDLLHFLRREGSGQEAELQLREPPADITHADDPGQVHRNDRRQGRAADVHAQTRHKDEVERDIRHAGDD